MAEFVTINEDKFEKKTVYTTTEEVKINSDGKLLSPEYGHYNAIFIREASSNGTDTLQLKIINWCLYGFKEEDANNILKQIKNGEQGGLVKYGRLEQGKIDIIVDNDVIQLSPCVHGKDYCIYNTDKETLKRICDAKEFAMRVSGRDDFSFELTSAIKNDFLIYARKCYNGFYDKSAYTEALTQSTSSGGCMGILALMIISSAALIGGVCSLV